MQNVVEKVMETFGMMRSLSERDLNQAQQALLKYLSDHPQSDEHRAAVEGLAFLRKQNSAQLVSHDDQARP